MLTTDEIRAWERWRREKALLCVCVHDCGHGKHGRGKPHPVQRQKPSCGHADHRTG